MVSSEEKRQQSAGSQAPPQPATVPADRTLDRPHPHSPARHSLPGRGGWAALVGFTAHSTPAALAPAGSSR